MVNQWRNYGADEDLYEICVRGPRLPFGAPTLWNAVSLHFEGRNHCFKPTAVRYVTVFNLRYVKNVKFEHFRGAVSIVNTVKVNRFMSGRLLLIGQNQPMVNPSNFEDPFELRPRGNLPPPLSAALASTDVLFWKGSNFLIRSGYCTYPFCY